MSTQRYKITLAYRGTRYHGWQTQALMDTYTGAPPPPGHGIPTIQETIERAIRGVLRHPITLTGSSRTDSGVHAKGQIAHFDTEHVQFPKDNIRKSVNHQLPGDIIIRHIEKVPDTFNAVHGTVRKRYQYAIWNAFDRPVFFNDLVWHRWQKLDIDAMQAAAALFVGEHDFTSFARPGHGRDSTVRTVYDCEVTYRPPRLVVGVEGSGFLWNMIRIMVGTLVQVGLGRHRPEAIIDMINAHDREAAGPTAPPHGLFLQWIQTRKEEPAPAAETPEGESAVPAGAADLCDAEDA
jgi:tRNA pseudouridine38-40 synthase